MRDSQIEIYSNKHAEMINSLNDNRLNYYVIGIIEEIAKKDTIELEENNILDVSDEYLKLEALEGIYNSIERDEDKIFFATAISENASLLGIRIANEFADKLNVLKSNTEETTDNEEDVEEPEEEQELDTPTPSLDTDTDVPASPKEPNEEEQEETKEEENEQSLEGPAIIAYKKETEELERKLEELCAKLNESENLEYEETKEMDEIINNTSYPEFENLSNEIDSVKKEIESISNSINEKTQEKEKYEKLQKEYEEFYKNKSLPLDDEFKAKMEIYDARIKECDNFIKENNEKKSNKERVLERLNIELSEVKGPLYNIEVWKLKELYDKEIEKLESTLKEVKALEDKYYNESRSIPLDVLSMSRKLENQIGTMKPLFTQLVGIRSDINLNNPEYKPLIDAIKNGRKINDEVKEEINNKYNPEKNVESSDIDNEKLKEYIEELKKQIAERKENIEKYYDALNDIKNVENLVKAGKTPDDLKEEIEKINNKIDTITDDKLKEELRGELNKALNPEKEQEKEVPEKPGEVKKDPNKWKKWISGAAGLVVGAGVVALTPITGVWGGLALAAGWQAIKKGVNAYHNSLLNPKPKKETKKENEVTNIEKTGKLAKFKETWQSWFRDENIIKNINWFLNGASIGSAVMGLYEGATGINYGNWNAPEITTTETISSEMTNGTTDPYSNIKIGDSANNLDLSKGYDQANWAQQNINAESLNQSIMYDGNSVIDGVRVTKDGITHVVETAGKSLTEVAQQLGVSPEELAINITNGQGAPRAWVDAAEAVGRTL